MLRIVPTPHPSPPPCRKTRARAATPATRRFLKGKKDYFLFPRKRRVAGVAPSLAHTGVNFSVPLFVLYVKRVLHIILNRYWHQLGPNLAQFWGRGDHASKYCWVLFGHLNLSSLRKRFLDQFWTSRGTKKHRKILTLMGEIEAACFCAMIVLETDLRQISGRFAPQNPTKVCPSRAPKSIQKDGIEH